MPATPVSPRSTNTVERLRQLIRSRVESDPVSNKTAIVRQALPDITAALEAGHTYERVAQWLKDANLLVITGAHLSVMVSRIRKQQKRNKAVAARPPEKDSNQLPLSLQKLKEAEAKSSTAGIGHDPTRDGRGLL